MCVIKNPRIPGLPTLSNGVCDVNIELHKQCSCAETTVWRHAIYIDSADTLLLFVHVHLCTYNPVVK